MARYKHIDTKPRFLPVDRVRQFSPGTFEHALNHLFISTLGDDISRIALAFIPQSPV